MRDISQERRGSYPGEEEFELPAGTSSICTDEGASLATARSAPVASSGTQGHTSATATARLPSSPVCKIPRASINPSEAFAATPAHNPASNPDLTLVDSPDKGLDSEVNTETVDGGKVAPVAAPADQLSFVKALRPPD